MITLVGDFETTVDEDTKAQKKTEVWASAVVELNTEDVRIFHSIEETFEYFLELNQNLIVYYHNLKFDGSFWMSYLMKELKFKQSVEDNDARIPVFKRAKAMNNGEFSYCISNLGSWYYIRIKVNHRIIELRDSLKLLPFSVAELGKGFKTKHRKLDMEYVGERYAGCTITDEEKAYIANDVLVVKEALEFMFSEGHNKLTIGACCLNEYKNIIGEDYEAFFPDLYQFEIDEEKYGVSNAGEYIRQSYKGGWCYLVHGKEGHRKGVGTTADVNSLYPSVMSSESGNFYPIGLPHFWQNIFDKKFLPEICKQNDCYYFVRIRTRFYLKEGKLPCIQIKRNPLYKPTEWLRTSDIYDPKTNRYSSTYYDFDGVKKSATVTLTLTKTDFELIKEHYELYDFEILDGCWFHAECGIFDEYIDKYRKIKISAKGAMRQLAKLFLNNLYGKMASSTDSSFKYAYLKEDGSVGYTTVIAHDKKAGYIAVGSAITSYARNFTIRAAQQNYYGVNKRGFIYADTDSIHCDLLPEEIKGIKVDDTAFCCWKLESCWDESVFTRQKTYIEHVTHEDLKPIEKPYYNVKCAGLPERCKQIFLDSTLGLTEEQWENVEDINMKNRWNKYDKSKKNFVLENHKIEDFKTGLKIPGKLVPKRIDGGVLLVEEFYEMR